LPNTGFCITPRKGAVRSLPVELVMNVSGTTKGIGHRKGD